MIRPLSRALLLTLAAATASSVLFAQDPSLRFEVASVRPSGPAPPGARGNGRGGLAASSPERLTYERALFRLLLMDAYGVGRDQIKGPEWATADANAGGALYDISATFPAGATKAQVATMLQNLLKDRFKLSLHHEKVQASGYALVVATGGPKLNESAGPVRESEQAAVAERGRVNHRADRDGFPDLFPQRNMGATFGGGTVRMRFRDYPLSDLVQQFSFALAMPITDRTGLSGRYDFRLEFTPPDSGNVGIRFTLPLAAGQQAPLNGAAPTSLQLDAVPIVSSAMEKQLGLKLEASRLAMDMLVIDYAEQTPTPN